MAVRLSTLTLVSLERLTYGEAVMAEGFDPYLKWLGIPPEEQPPNHYRLLAVPLFASDPDVIDNAADQRMAHLQRRGTGPHSDLSQKLLNEVAAARVCLLNPERKAAYDQQLKAGLAAAKLPAESPPVTTPQPPASTTAQAAPLTAPGPAAPKQLRTRAAPSPGLGRPATTRATAPLPLAASLSAPPPPKKLVRRKPVWKQPQVIGLVAVSALLLVGIAAFALTRGDSQPPPDKNLAKGSAPATGSADDREPAPVKPTPEPAPNQPKPRPGPKPADPAPTQPAQSAEPAATEDKPAVESAMGEIYLDDLPETDHHVGAGELGKHGANGFGGRAQFRGREPQHMLATHGTSGGVTYVEYRLPPACQLFCATVGMQTRPFGPVTFKVVGDGKSLWESRQISQADDSEDCRVKIAGVRQLRLEVHCVGGFEATWAAWVNPRLLRSASNDESASDAASPSSDTRGAVDLLTLIDPKRDAVEGEWKREGGVLVSPKDEQFARIEIPYQVPEEYVLTARVMREPQSGRFDLFSTGLVAGGRQFQAPIDCEDVTGLHKVDGKQWNENETTRAGRLLRDDGEADVVQYIVRKSGVTVVVDGRTVIDWKGDFSRLSLHDNWRVKRPERLFLGASCRFHISKLELQPLSDNTPVVKLAPDGMMADDATKRAPLPSTEEQRAARKVLREAFSDGFAKAKKPDERMKLAAQLLARGRETQSNPTDRYVLFDESRAIAVETGNYVLAGEAIEELAAQFEVDAGALRAEALLETAKKAKGPADFKAAAQAALDLMDGVEEASNWERAEQLAKAAVSLSARARDPELAKSAKERSQLLTAHKKMAAEADEARAALQKDADDPQANLTLGQYLCLVRHDWKAGLPLLAKSSDEQMKALAQAELKEPAGAAESAKLADRWWEFGNTLGGESRAQCLVHAADWYQRATDSGLSGIDAAKAAKRIGEAGSLGGGTASGEHLISYLATYTSSSGWAPLETLLTGFGPLYRWEFAFHTNDEAGPHITIDLGAEKTVRRLEIENRRLDGYYNRARDMALWLSVAKGERGPLVWRSAEGLTHWNVVLPKPVRARYVTLGLPADRSDIFHLAGVKVYGSESVLVRGAGGAGRVRKIHPALGYPLREHPPDAVAFHGHWYKWIDNPVNVTEAYRQCAAMGGYLACLETEEEYEFIRKMSLRNGFWFGLYQAANGKWIWLSGAPLSINHWLPREPSGDGPTVEFQPNGGWNDNTGGDKTFVCEWEY